MNNQLIIGIVACLIIAYSCSMVTCDSVLVQVQTDADAELYARYCPIPEGIAYN